MVVKTILSPDEEAVAADPMAANSGQRLLWEALARGDSSAAIESAGRINAPQVIEESFPINAEGGNVSEYGRVWEFGFSVETGVHLELETPKAVKDSWNSDRLLSIMEVNLGEMCLAALD